MRHRAARGHFPSRGPETQSGVLVDAAARRPGNMLTSGLSSLGVDVPSGLAWRRGHPMLVMRWKNAGAAGRHLRRAASIALLLVMVQSGCSREFYREWANQDASEAVFEKSRDPR